MHIKLEFDLPQIDKSLEGGEEHMFQGIGSTELLIIAAILLVLFGGKKLPELARGVGDSIKEFRKASKETA